MIVTIGEILVDCFVRESGREDSNSLEIISKAGGSPFNVALGVSRLGDRSGFIGKISRDVFGDFLYNFIQREGISTKYICRSDKSTSLAYLNTDASKNINYTFNLSNCSDLSLRIDQIPNIASLGSVKVIHFGSYAIVRPIISETIYQLLSRFSDKKMISFDVNLRTSVEAAIPKWQSRFKKFARVATIIKMSIADYTGLYDLASTEIDHNYMLDELLKFGAKLVIVTLDKSGVIAKTAKGVMVHQDVYAAANSNNEEKQRQKIIDSTGAGDSFMAATLVRLKQKEINDVENLQKDELLSILSFAQKAASFTISQQGAELPTLLDLEKF